MLLRGRVAPSARGPCARAGGDDGSEMKFSFRCLGHGILAFFGDQGSAQRAQAWSADSLVPALLSPGFAPGPENAREHLFFDLVDVGARAPPRPGQADLDLRVDDAVLQHDDAISESRGFFRVVSDEHCGEASFHPEPLDERLHIEARQSVERPERLVEEEQFRLSDERPGQRNPLFLAS